MRAKDDSDTNRYQVKSHGWLGNILFNMKSAWVWDKKLFWYQLLPVIPNVTAAYLGLLLPAELVRGLEEQWDIQTLLIRVLTLAAWVGLFRLIDHGMGEYIYRNGPNLMIWYEICCCHKVMRLNYQMLEDPDCSKLIGSTWNVLRRIHQMRYAVESVPRILGSLAGIIWYGWLILQKNWVILAVSAANTLLSMIMLAGVRRKHAELQEQISRSSAQMAYISRESMNSRAGKDIRIYRMTEWFLQKYDHSLTETDSVYGQIHDRYFYRAVLDGLMTLILNLFSYGYLLFLLTRGELSASQFILYIGLIGSFASCFNEFMGQLTSLNQICVSLDFIRSFLNLEECPGWSDGVGEEKIKELEKQGVSVEFDHVSFTYPGNEEPALKDLSMRIEMGEKLALIGLNGAGKTTLAKLLCGFYAPTQGEIRINGIPVSEFSREEYFRLVSVLFQDSALLPISLDANLTGESLEWIDRKRLAWAMRMSGFAEKYEKLPQQGETMLVKEVNGESSDFSGGEKQKLLFARALYKNAPLMILDEPTAALDPIAENEMYQNFGMAAEGRTCLYISHRLSSTRFCDRILLMEKGKILEEGTHEELMRKKERYAELFRMQSQYYRGKENELS